MKLCSKLHCESINNKEETKREGERAGECLPFKKREDCNSGKSTKINEDYNFYFFFVVVVVVVVADGSSCNLTEGIKPLLNFSFGNK